MNDCALLCEEYRGGLLDLVHEGYVCVVDENSRIVAHAGNPEAMVYYRSASKPLQALPVIARRLDEQYGITEEESVIFSGSHLGEDFHVKALRSIFKKAGLSEDDLIMKPTAPGSMEANEARIRAGLPKAKIYHNCSGKHAGAMLFAKGI